MRRGRDALTPRPDARTREKSRRSADERGRMDTDSMGPAGESLCESCESVDSGGGFLRQYVPGGEQEGKNGGWEVGENSGKIVVRFSIERGCKGRVTTMTDRDLLEEYAREGSQRAFAELVGRHVDWLHTAAGRPGGGFRMSTWPRIWSRRRCGCWPGRRASFRGRPASAGGSSGPFATPATGPFEARGGASTTNGKRRP